MDHKKNVVFSLGKTEKLERDVSVAFYWFS